MTSDYFDNEQNVDSYIKMVDGYDGASLVDILRRHLAPGATVLELGMGPGKDLTLLSQHFEVTGSDSSKIFVDRYRAEHPESDVFVLDAVSMNLDRRFNAIYSNKVLQHLTKDDAARSLAGQHRVLQPGGIALHSLWYGDSVEEHHGLLFQQYTKETFSALVAPHFNVVESARFKELEADDSLYVILQRRDAPKSLLNQAPLQGGSTLNG
jgi:SAM-dependent methyltransferase